MKLFLFLTAAAFFVNSASASEVKMTFTAHEDRPINRLWLPCSFGLCMIDLAGDGSITNMNDFSKTLPVVSSTNITTVSGTQTCDIVQAPQVELADKVFANKEFHRCDWFPANNSPMLGLDYFRGQKFSFNFTKGTFSWLERDLQEPKVKLSTFGFWNYAWVKIGGLHRRIVIDTGAPLTLVDKAFVQDNPEFFEVSKDSPDRAILQTLISIEGVQFSDLNVMVIDLKAAFGPYAPDFFLGMNHIQEMDWELDYQNLEMHFQPVNVPPKVF